MSLEVYDKVIPHSALSWTPQPSASMLNVNVYGSTITKKMKRYEIFGKILKFEDIFNVLTHHFLSTFFEIK